MRKAMEHFKRGFMSVLSPVLIGAMYIIPPIVIFFIFITAVMYAPQVVMWIGLSIALVVACYAIGSCVLGAKNDYK